MNDNRGNGFDKDQLLKQKQKRMENVEEYLEQYKKHHQVLKSDLVRVLTILKRKMTDESQKKRLNARKDLLKKDIEMIGLMIDTYEFRIKVKKLDKEYKELVSRNLKGEFVDDLLKSNRYEVELLEKQDKENSDKIKELLKELGEKKRKYRDQYQMIEMEQEIKLMKKRESGIPNGPQKDKLIKVRRKFEINAKWGEMIRKNKNTLLEIVKNDEGYKILLEQKKLGEDVESLIKQNRIYAESLARKEREYSEEAKKWAQSEEGRKWFEETESFLLRERSLTRDKPLFPEKEKKMIKELKPQANNQMDQLLRISAQYLGENIKNEIIQKRSQAKDSVKAEAKKKGKLTRLHDKKVGKKLLKTKKKGKKKTEPLLVDSPQALKYFLKEMISERGSSLNLELCEKLITDLKKSLGRELIIEDVQLAADFFVEQEESSTTNKWRRKKKK
jgi:hypothetical protein